MTVAYPCSLASVLAQCGMNRTSYLTALRRFPTTASLGHAQLVALWQNNGPLRHGPLKGMAGVLNAWLRASC